MFFLEYKRWTNFQNIGIDPFGADETAVVSKVILDAFALDGVSCHAIFIAHDIDTDK